MLHNISIATNVGLSRRGWDRAENDEMEADHCVLDPPVRLALAKKCGENVCEASLLRLVFKYRLENLSETVDHLT